MTGPAAALGRHVHFAQNSPTHPVIDEMGNTVESIAHAVTQSLDSSEDVQSLAEKLRAGYNALPPLDIDQLAAAIAAKLPSYRLPELINRLTQRPTTQNAPTTTTSIFQKLKYFGAAAVALPLALKTTLDKVLTFSSVLTGLLTFYVGREAIHYTTESTITFVAGKENYNWLAHNFCQIPGVGYLACQPSTVQLADIGGLAVGIGFRVSGAVATESLEQGTSYAQNKINSFTDGLAHNIETSVDTLANFVTGSSPSEKNPSLPFTTNENVFSQNNTGREPFSLNMGTVALLAAGVALVYFGEKAISKYFASSETMAEEPKKEKIKAK